MLWIITFLINFLVLFNSMDDRNRKDFDIDNVAGSIWTSLLKISKKIFF